MSSTRRKPNFWLRALIIFIIVAFIIITVALTSGTNELLKDKKLKEEKLYEEELKLDELESKYNSEIDDEYIEEVARENGYNKQDEVIFYNNLPES